MAKRLYVGNLNFKTSEDELKGLFEKDGGKVADCRIITDRETGRSRGFGFVEMESDEDAQKAIDTLDGFEVDGRALKINFARERRPARRRENW